MQNPKFEMEHPPLEKYLTQTPEELEEIMNSHRAESAVPDDEVLAVRAKLFEEFEQKLGAEGMFCYILCVISC
jgi:hypothetical protein